MAVQLDPAKLTAVLREQEAMAAFWTSLRAPLRPCWADAAVLEVRS